MKVFSAKRISKTYGEKDVFVDLDFHIQEKDKIGIVGVNGTGKSSLLRVIAGVEEPDTGSFASPKDYTVGYLAQVPELDDHLTVLEIVFQGKSSLMELVKEYEEVLAKLDKNPKNELYQQQLFDLQRKMDAENAWDAVTNAETILSKLGFANVNEKAAYLSGGQRKRAALAQVLVDTPDLLLLDEPTNHLDYGSIQWLEEYLRKYDKAFVVVSHDRYFLDRVTNRMAELHDGNIYFYDGNYQSYIEAKALREEEEMLAEKKRRNMYRRELEWIKRGAKARSTKQKARIQRFEQLEAKLGGFSTGENPDITIGSSRLGKKVFEFMNASKSFDHKTIMSEFNWIVKPGDRIGIVGENGSGKSTFLNILAGETVLDTGTLDIGPTVKTAYYRQTNEDMNGDQRMIAYIQELGNEIETSSGDVLSAAQMLERFLFPKHTHGTLIRKLSGGEKRRLYLLRLLMSKPNVLLLDEPTNDLDTETLTVLEDFIEEFRGVVISVSHDRYFLDKTAKELLVFHGNGRIDHYYGSFTDYIEEKKEQLAEVPVDRKVESKKEATLLASKKKMTYKEKKEWETIEKDIEQVEEKLEVLQQELNDTGSDFERAQEIMEKIQNESANLEHLIERWTYLSELDNESF
ncbi:multidrug ABC transporter ATP-binding protein [Bacillus sp. VT-16-64]|nr:ABC-F family ATP-binding cassette domain-containing protein [Siminovitchia thermophila]ONK21958.1 multidrug ABC transporter ATP-binding protein [Bacillus sp. VT-16-64]